MLESHEPRVDPDRGPAKYVRAGTTDRLRVGFITGTSDTFCEACDRLRVAADGMLRPCLATDVGVSAKVQPEAGDAAPSPPPSKRRGSSSPTARSGRAAPSPPPPSVSMRAIGG